MKTKFEDLWSEINYTSNYDNSKIRLWYLNDNQLEPLALQDILKREDKMIQIYKNADDDHITEIPIYRIYVISHGSEILMDRREGNYQVENLEINLT